MSTASFTPQQWAISNLPETLLQYLSEDADNEGSKRKQDFVKVLFGFYWFFPLSTVSLSVFL
jgi:hypothetical protein